MHKVFVLMPHRTNPAHKHTCNRRRHNTDCRLPIDKTHNDRNNHDYLPVQPRTCINSSIQCIQYTVSVYSIQQSIQYTVYSIQYTVTDVYQLPLPRAVTNVYELPLPRPLPPSSPLAIGPLGSLQIQIRTLTLGLDLHWCTHLRLHLQISPGKVQLHSWSG